MRKFKVGDIVADQDFDVGVIVEIDNPKQHNIYIKLLNVNGHALCCAAPGCYKYDKLRLLQAADA